MTSPGAPADGEYTRAGRPPACDGITMSRTDSSSGPAGMIAPFASTPARASSADSSQSGGAPEAAFPSRSIWACGCTEVATAYLRKLTVTVEVRQYLAEDSAYHPHRPPPIHLT